MHIVHNACIFLTGVTAVLAFCFAVRHEESENDAKLFAILIALLAIATR